MTSAPAQVQPLKSTTGRKLFGPLTYVTLGLFVAAIFLQVGMGSLPTARDWWRSRKAVRDIHSKDPMVALHAADRLRDARSSGQAYLLEAATDPDESVRMLAFDRIMPAGPRVDSASNRANGPRVGTFEVMLKGLRDANPTIRLAAAGLVARVGAAGKPAGPELARMMTDDPDPSVRLAAAHALSQVDPTRNAEVQQALIALMVDPDPAHNLIRSFIARQLGARNPQVAARILSPLIDLLASPHVELRRQAISCLEALGPNALGATGMLGTVLRDDPDLITRCQAAIALDRILGPGARNASRLVRELEAASKLPPDARFELTKVNARPTSSAGPDSGEARVLLMAIDEWLQQENNRETPPPVPPR